ncbi:MAG TPA: hypothetical protein VFW97_08375 [Acidimicrobiia bacterium]|nr:hypothetical protein [Acidimicrobiia bacterium]
MGDLDFREVLEVAEDQYRALTMRQPVDPFQENIEVCIMSRRHALGDQLVRMLTLALRASMPTHSIDDRHPQIRPRILNRIEPWSNAHERVLHEIVDEATIFCEHIGQTARPVTLLDVEVIERRSRTSYLHTLMSPQNLKRFHGCSGRSIIAPKLPGPGDAVRQSSLAAHNERNRAPTAGQHPSRGGGEYVGASPLTHRRARSRWLLAGGEHDIAITAARGKAENGNRQRCDR